MDMKMEYIPRAVFAVALEWEHTQMFSLLLTTPISVFQATDGLEDYMGTPGYNDIFWHKMKKIRT